MPKISELPTAGSVSSSDYVPVVVGGVTKKAAISTVTSAVSVTTPTGTGFARVTSGAYDAAASAVNLAGGSTHVTGVLPAANGGTGQNTSASTGVAKVAAGTWSVASIVNADIDAAAAIALSKTALSANAQAFLATPSSANLRTLVSDETGTGALFFAGGNFGAASGTSVSIDSKFALVTDGAGTLTVGGENNAGASNAYDETRIAGTVVSFPNNATSSLPVASGATGAALSNASSTQTNDATVTSLFTWTIPDETGTVVTAEVVALLDTGAETGAWVRRARIKRDGGTVSMSAIESVYTSEETAAWDVTIDNSGSTGRVRVTGEAAHDIAWFGVVSRLYTHNL